MTSPKIFKKEIDEIDLIWRCCEKSIRSNYCPTCGNQRPSIQENVTLREADELYISHFLKDKIAAEKSVQTIKSKLSKFQRELDDIDIEAECSCTCEEQNCWAGTECGLYSDCNNVCEAHIKMARLKDQISTQSNSLKAVQSK